MLLLLPLVLRGRRRGDGRARMTGVAKVLVRRGRNSARKTGRGRSLGYYRETGGVLYIGREQAGFV